MAATKPSKPHNLVYLQRDRGYRFEDRDPAMEELCDLIDKSGMSVGDIVKQTHKATNGVYAVSPGTINNWLSGQTRRPQNLTLTWVGYALGYQRKWTKLP